MAADARGTGGAVIEHHAQPGGGNVAGITRGRGRNVCRSHTGGNHTVVATLASASHLIVIH